MKTAFREKLEHLLNCESMEQYSDTPDFILADFLTDCLESYDRALQAREKWYGRPINSCKAVDVLVPQTAPEAGPPDGTNSSRWAGPGD